jgi:hypothetical protein
MVPLTYTPPTDILSVLTGIEARLARLAASCPPPTVPDPSTSYPSYNDPGIVNYSGGNGA